MMWHEQKIFEVWADLAMTEKTSLGQIVGLLKLTWEDKSESKIKLSLVGTSCMETHNLFLDVHLQESA